MTTGALLFYGGVALWSAFLSYVILFSLLKQKEKVVIQAAPPVALEPRPVAPVYGNSEKDKAAATPSNLEAEGFKAFQTGAELTVEDIVKGLSRMQQGGGS